MFTDGGDEDVWAGVGGCAAGLGGGNRQGGVADECVNRGGNQVVGSLQVVFELVYVEVGVAVEQWGGQVGNA